VKKAIREIDKKREIVEAEVGVWMKGN